MCVALTLPLNSHEAKTSVPLVLGSWTTGSNVPAFHPAIESILYNPSVYKEQLSRNLIRAVGYGLAGQAHFIIHFRNEELHDTWQSFYGNNQRCDSGRLYRNLPTGEWKTWYPDGRLKTLRTYNAEKYQYIKADLQRNHPKDQRYAITRLGSSGSARHFQPQYDGTPGNSQPLPLLQKIQHNTSGTDNSGYLPPFANCLHHGAFVNYDADGNIKDSGHYENGLRHGLWKESVNGNMQAIGFYRHSVRQGQWKYYNAARRLVYTEQYNWNGKRKAWHYFTD
jgi:antitoxin component YwqK of YwqJK toxin-antitoxin module